MNLEEQLELLTPHILPPGCTFSNQQKTAILLEGNANIVAGPGSGKTTVLIAKCGLLLKEYTNSNNGICLITHTNVAVDEIMIGLKKLGIDSIEYPSFIGTIQDFINTFFARKSFHFLLGDKQFKVIDDDEYQEKFKVIFQQQKPEWYTFPAPSVNNGKAKLEIANDLSFTFNSNVPPSYRESFNKSIQILFDQGYVTNHQCLELAIWYINKHAEEVKKAIQMRFKYVLLDEAQDTSQLQYEILNLLFSKSNVCFQRYGDPYQALYSIYDGNNDAWIPSVEEDIPYEEISETSRFGSYITDIVKNICIEKYETFKSLNLIDSFKPYYIVYRNEEELLEQYKGLIEYCKNESESFSLSKKKDAILAAFHSNLIDLFPNYDRPSNRQRKEESTVTVISNFIFSLLAREIGITFKEMKEEIYLNQVCKVIISKCIKEIVSENVSYDAITNYLEDTLKLFSDNELSTFSKVDINKEVDSFLKRSSYKEISKSPVEIAEFYYGTIHSAKGETHRSTLLLLNTFFENHRENTKYSMFNLLKEYFAGNYINPMTILDEIEKDETIKALKLAYVALSRPTHLLGIAIPEVLISDDRSILERLNSNGWIKYEPTFATLM